MGVPRTQPLRLAPGEVKAVLQGLSRLRVDASIPEQLDRLAERIADVLPAWQRGQALADYRQPMQGSTP